MVQHSGKSVHPERQKGPHAHCVTLDPGNRFAFVCDLGLDKVLGLPLRRRQGQAQPRSPPPSSLKPGAGPRHMVFRPDGRFAYVLNELNSTVTAFAYDAKAGALKRAADPVHAARRTTTAPTAAAEIDVHPSGKFLYVSNRGHNSVVLFAIDADKGTLTYVEEQGTGGKKPRALRHRALGQTPGHRQPGLGHRAGLPHRRRQRPPETLGRVRQRAHARLREVPAPRP